MYDERASVRNDSPCYLLMFFLRSSSLDSEFSVLDTVISCDPLLLIFCCFAVAGCACEPVCYGLAFAGMACG